MERQLIIKQFNFSKDPKSWLVFCLEAVKPNLEIIVLQDDFFINGLIEKNKSYLIELAEEMKKYKLKLKIEVKADNINYPGVAQLISELNQILKNKLILDVKPFTIFLTEEKNKLETELLLNALR